MHISGEWFRCDDGIVRPIVRGEIRAADGSWLYTPFLVDTGADCTALDYYSGLALGFRFGTPTAQLGGVGGTVNAVVVPTEVRLTDESGAKVLFRSQYAASVTPDALDMCVLGRDVTDLFALIVDMPGNVVCMVSQRHSYRVERR